jgi:dihydropteroate synthase
VAREALEQFLAVRNEPVYVVARLEPPDVVTLADSARRRGVPTLASATHCFLCGAPAELDRVLETATARIGQPIHRDTDTARPAATAPLDGLRPLPISASSPLIMGVLNVTPDSFSDGGRFNRTDRAIERAREIAAEGADILDVGGESTRPGSDSVPAETEIARVVPVIRALGGAYPIPISIDTSKSVVASAAIEAGASIVNDVTGLRADAALAQVAARAGAPLVLCHIQGTPKTMQNDPQYDDLMHDVCRSLLDSVDNALSAGVVKSRIVLDPGVGFGKRFTDNLEILRRLPEIVSLGFPVLVGASRKSFLGRILDSPPQRRLEASLAAAEIARLGGAAIVRVHDIAETRRFFDTIEAIGGAPPKGRDR